LSRPEVTLIFPEQYDEVARVLARAFVGDPLLWAILPEPKDIKIRATRLEPMFAVALEIHRRQGLPVFGVLDKRRVVGAAVAGGVSRSTVAQLVAARLSQFPRLMAALGAGGTMRVLRARDELSRNHPAEPHIYLFSLGVDPDFQGQHFGKALLDHLAAIASKRELFGVFLETTKPSNVPYYQSAGYQVIGKLQPIGVEAWCMLQKRRIE